MAKPDSTPDPGFPSVGTDRTAAPARFFYGWRIVGGAFLIYFVGGGLFTTATVFFKALAGEFGWSRGELSGAFSLGFAVAGLSVLFWGRIADRRGPRSSLLPAALITGVLCLLLSRISGILSLYALYAVFAFGSGGISLIPIGVLLSNWFVRRRGRAIGIAYTGGGFGILLLAPVAGALVTTVGWRGSYLLAGLVVLLVVVPIAFWITNHPGDRGLLPDGVRPEPAGTPSSLGDGRPADPGLSLRDALATSAFWILALTWILTQMAVGALYLHQVPLLTDQGLSTEMAALAAGGVGGMGILGRLGFGLLAERTPTSRLYAGCYLMYALGIAFLGATASLGTVSLLLYVGVFGIGVGGSWALSPLIVGQLFGVRALGEIFGLLGLIATLGGAVGSTGAGVVFDCTGGYALALAVAIALSVIGAILMLFVRAPLVSRSSPAP